MKTIEAIKKAIKMNEALKQFALKPKYIALDVSGVRFEIEELKDLNSLKKEYVKEFYENLMQVELDEFYEAKGTFNYSTYEGKPYIWNSEYEISLIVVD